MKTIVTRTDGLNFHRPRAIGHLLLLILGLMVTGFMIPVHEAMASSPPCKKEIPSPSIPSIRLKMLTKGLNNPTSMTHAGDGSQRLFIVEQQGSVRIWKEGRLLKDPFLDIRSRVTSGGEKGLLGLAFHPLFSENGRFFVNYTSRSGGLHTVISQFKVNPHLDVANKNTEVILLTIAQPYPNHNGGQIAFGPDGKLYIGTGDGGARNDPKGHGQNLASFLGKILRIDVDSKEGNRPYGIPTDNPFWDHGTAAPEIWAYGLRNPWRFSFDSVTGLLYAADVGQNAREEIDVIKKGKNYGWSIMEGTICTPGIRRKCNKEGLELPIWDYPRPQGTVVIGGNVYRGHSIPGLCGVYLYADYGNGEIFGLRYDGHTTIAHRKVFSTRHSISSFGEDENHELYIVDLDGKVFKIIPTKRP